MDQNIIITESSRNLRALGRDALRGKWKLGVLGTLLYMVLVLVPMVILNAIFGHGASPAGVSTIYSILISGPMTLGYAMFSISIFRKRETTPAEVFYGFERFGKALGLYIVMLIFIILWSLLLIVPGIIAAFRYSMCFYILADKPDIGIMEALNESKRMMRGNKWKLFCLNISFIGWAVLAGLPIAIGTIVMAPLSGMMDYAYFTAVIYILGVGFLWLTPYMEVSMIAFYDIANGSLRAARSIAEEGGFRSEASIDGGMDPITVYKDEPEAGTPEIAEPETVEPEIKEVTEEQKDEE